MPTTNTTTCPGCGLHMPASESAHYDGYINASPECWSVYSEVLAVEYSDAVLFGQAHQFTVDAYAAQHPGGNHPEKSIAIHLAGLHLLLERDVAPERMPALRKHLADTVATWPHFPPPGDRGALTVFDVAMVDTPQEHVDMVQQWAASVWEAWSHHHAGVVAFVNDHFAFEE